MSGYEMEALPWDRHVTDRAELLFHSTHPSDTDPDDAETTGGEPLQPREVRHRRLARHYRRRVF